MAFLIITGHSLTIPDLVSVARNNVTVKLGKEAFEAITQCRLVVDDALHSGEVVYGITTGFGKLCNATISKEESHILQENLLRSHAVGVGDVLPKDVVRAAMLLRINSLAAGHSGIRHTTVETLIELLNRDIIPVVPEKGSLGASGDLAPLAHISLALIGEGDVFYEGERIPTSEALELEGITPVDLAAKEGLALINGTQIMTAIMALQLHDAQHLLKIADIAGAMAVEALKGTDTAFLPQIQLLRPHQGQIECAENVLSLLDQSEIRLSHIDCPKVQDAYSLRCIPQVHGASRDAIIHAIKVVEIEMNAVTDNPLVFPQSKRILSGGNFHGQPIALVADYCSCAMAEIGNISERRINRYLDPTLSDLPAFLVENSGLNSGYMIPQYTAASLVSENKGLAHPASVDSVPVCANQEDHVSMGTIGARQFAQIMANVRHILAIELLCACQALDFHLPMKLGKGTSKAHKTIRKEVKGLSEDRMIIQDIERIVSIIEKGFIVNAVEKAIKTLH